MNYFLDPVQNHYFDFEGRVGLRPYWMFVLYYVIIAIIVSIVTGVLHLQILYHVFVLAMLLPSLGLTARRLHDINKSGWWILISLIPIVGWVWIVVLNATAGDKGANAYGADPAGGSAPSTPAAPTPPTA